MLHVPEKCLVFSLEVHLNSVFSPRIQATNKVNKLARDLVVNSFSAVCYYSLLHTSIQTGKGKRIKTQSLFWSAKVYFFGKTRAGRGGLGGSSTTI